MSMEEQGGALDVHGAAEALAALDDTPASTEQAATAQEAQQTGAQNEGETEEQAAERLVREEAQGEEGAEGEQKPDDAPQSFTIKVDGKDVILTADEMAEHVKNGMRQADYTKKTMEVAEQRKSAEAQAAEARKQRDEYATKLEGFSAYANHELKALQAQLTEELLQNDPMEYLKIERTFKERQAQAQQAQQELRQIDDQRAQERAEAERQHFQRQQELLLAKVPEWKDPEKARTEVTKIKEYLVKQGYEAAESDFNDHRQIILARKAMQFDALMERAKGAVQKVAKLPPKVERSGTPEVKAPDGRTSAMKRLGQTGSIDDAAAAFAQFM